MQGASPVIADPVKIGPTPASSGPGDPDLGGTSVRLADISGCAALVGHWRSRTIHGEARPSWRYGVKPLLVCRAQRPPSAHQVRSQLVHLPVQPRTRVANVLGARILVDQLASWEVDHDLADDSALLVVDRQ